MKPLLFLVLLAVCLPGLQAQDVLLKDGKVLRSLGIRREGNFLFLKATNPEGAVSETLLQLNLVDRIVFGEVPVLVELRQQAATGNVEGVLAKTEPLLPFARPFADIPGNLWAEVLRLRLSALAVSPRPEAFAALQKQWLPTGDADLEAAVKLVASKLSGTDRKALEQTCRSLAVPGPHTVTAGVAWLELGAAALETREWKAALRAFLSVGVFAPAQRLLQPAALLGAIRAFVGMEDFNSAKSLLEELRTEYPGAAELKQASALIPLPPPVGVQN